MKTKLLFLARVVVYLLAFLLPPVLVRVVGMKAVESVCYEAPRDAAKVQAGDLPASPRHDPDKPTAVVLLSNQGSEVTDVLAPYEVLSESAAFNVYAAAPEREVVPLSRGLDVLPQLSLAELDRRLGGEDPDVIVRPQVGRERVMAGFSAAPKETVVGSFRPHSDYDPLPALRRYGGPILAVITLVNDAQFGLHNLLGAGLPHTAFTGTGRWLQMDKSEEFDRILDEFLAQVRVTGALRYREPGK